MEAACSSKSLYPITILHGAKNPENHEFYLHHHENLKSHIKNSVTDNIQY